MPDGFVRIRHFGLLANRRRAAALAHCRALLAQPVPLTVPPESVRALMLRVTGIDIERCPSCQQGVLRPLDVLPPVPLAWDTSFVLSSISVPGMPRPRPRGLHPGTRSPHRTPVATPQGRLHRLPFPLLARPSSR